MKHRQFSELILLGILTGIGILFLVLTNILIQQPHQQFVDLADSFLHGRLYFGTEVKNVYDASYYKDNFFWPLGPLPAVLLMPFVAIFGQAVYQGLVQFLLVCLSFILLFKIAKKILEDKLDAIWLSFGFVFGSAYIGVALLPWSWQFGQIVATLFLLAALYEYLYYRRWFLIGLFLALAIAARMDLILALVYFIAMLLVTEKKRFANLISLLLPIGMSIFLLLLYNYYRFDNALDQGYMLQTLTNMELQGNRNAALWSLIHIPANFYYFFFRGPDGVFLPGTKILTYPFLQADHWGMSVFFTSPLFLWIVNAQFKKKEVLFAAITAIILAIAIFGYYGIGYMQYGYRYALDFYPFLYLVLLYAVKDRVSLLLKVIILFAFFFNMYMNYYVLFL